MYGGLCSRERLRCESERKREKTFWSTGRGRNGLRHMDAACKFNASAFCFSTVRIGESRAFAHCRASMRACLDGIESSAQSREYSEISGCVAAK